MSFDLAQALLDTQMAPSKKGKIHVAIYENEQYRIVGIKTLLKLTSQELCNGPYIIRVEDPTYGKTYFVGNDEPFIKLQSEGKRVRWLHDLFEAWRQNLIRIGFPKKISIYKWTLDDIFIHEVALKTFPGSKMEVHYL